jgi:hypothetical protein
MLNFIVFCKIRQFFEYSGLNQGYSIIWQWYLYSDEININKTK